MTAEAGPLPEQVLQKLREIIADCDALSEHARALCARLKPEDPLLGVMTTIKLRGAWLRAECFKASSETVFHKHPSMDGGEEPAEMHSYHHESRRRPHPEPDRKMAAAGDHTLDDAD